MKHCLNYTWFVVSYVFGKTYISNICEHATKKIVRVKEGKKRKGFVTIPLSENGSPDYCICCMNKMAIRCAWCGESIHIGDPVTLSWPADDGSFKIPDYAVKYGEGDQLVVCLRRGCGEYMCRYGFWMAPGVVRKG